MNHLILLSVAVFAVLLIAQKKLLQENIPAPINAYLGVVYDNNTVVGAVLLLGAYYMYTQDAKKTTVYMSGTSDLASSI